MSRSKSTQTSTSPPADRGRAVVVGSSMAGLLAARVLADHYGEVVIVERDRVPTDPSHRRGVPQGRHLHALLGRGGEILRELFPGIGEDFREAGALAVRSNGDVRFVSEHGVLPRIRITEPLVSANRPLLEHVVRQRVLALPEVSLRDETDVTGVLHDDGRVTGVSIFPKTAGAESWLQADLVVDASGRGGRTGAWLAALGFERPAEETIRTDLRYVTARFRLPADAVGDRLVLVTPRPELPFGLAAAAVEGQTWTVTLFGYGRYQPSARDEDFLNQLAAVAPADLLAAARSAEQVGEVVTHHLPTSLRRRYELLTRFPRGLLVIGDAVCSFNPIYGQGMTVAAQEALVLHDWLRSRSQDPRTYFRAVASVVQVAWDVVACGDLALPEVPGPRPLSVRVMGRYLSRLQAAACADPTVATAYLKVVAMLERPTTLLRPRVALRVLLRGRHRAPAAASPHAPAAVDPPQLSR